MYENSQQTANCDADKYFTFYAKLKNDGCKNVEYNVHFMLNNIQYILLCSMLAIYALYTYTKH